MPRQPLNGLREKRIDGDKFLIFRARHGQGHETRPLFQTLKSNSPFSAPRDDTARASCGNGAKRKLLSFFVSTLKTIQTLTQRCGIEPVILHPFAALIPVLGLHHVVLDAEFLQPTVQVEPERTRFITSHHVTGELLLFNHKEHELLIGHLLHGLRSRPVDLTAYPVILGVGVNAEFDGVVGGG